MNKTEIEVFVGVDMAKEEHYAQAITTQGFMGFIGLGLVG